MDTWLFSLHVVDILMLSSLVLLAGITQTDSTIWGGKTVCIHEYSAHISLISSDLVVLSL